MKVRRCPRCEGVTLIELAIVLAVVSIVAAIAIPSYITMLPHIDLKNAASDIGGVLLESRVRSIREVKDYTITFNLAGNTYSVTPEGGAPGPDYIPSKRVELYSDGSDPSVPPFSGNNVVFRPNGTAVTAGYEAVYLRNRPQTAERYRVKILGTTGKVNVERWTGGSWISAF